ncbi:MAG: hypothetical protein SFY67_16500 [Candidatus Melainabacteria bacterium]|nr:hypothetical protein [Candidatus Melainabacteria bacterium]
MTFSFNGKPFNPDEFKKQIEKVAYKSAANHVAQESGIDKLICPTHGKKPITIPFQNKSRNRAEMRFEFCCEELKASAQKLLN